MNDARSAKDVFVDAIELPASEREAFVRSRCGGDAVLLDEVRQLLAAHSRAGDFLHPAAMTARAMRAVEGPGSIIGRYKLLQEIGEGGFGTVFMAEQERPVRRRVAFKIIKLGMDTRQVIARFEQERQALALMDHPNIAKVLDAGATETGRPYFVMDLVKGEPITEYCDKNNLTIPERLELLGQVCQAVQHAHTKGVIHRDLKPSNILVTTQDGRALVRVIDFGIAKATDQRLTERTVFTEFRQLIGTPEYMSPEQAEGGLDIDTRTDVYSLGVLMYELLTGSTPFDPRKLRSAAYSELQRIIREDDPPKPSTRLSRSSETLPGVAARRRIDPSRLGSLVRGELDWIVMKSLEKDRSRRYDSPSALAADLERYLTGDAVSAAPPSTVYRFRKFVRRHRVAAIAGGVAAVTLLLGVIGTSIGLVLAREERDRAIAAERLARQRLAEAEAARTEAERSFSIANSVTEFFTHDVLDPHPTPPGQQELTVRQAVDRIPAKIEKYFTKQPAVEGAIRERVGQLYLNMGDPRRAAEFLERGAALLEQGLGPEHRTTLMALQRVGELMLDLEHFDKAEEIFDRVYQRRLVVLGPDHNFTINSMARRGTARVEAGKVEVGLRDLEQAFGEITRLRGRASNATLILTLSLVEGQETAGRLADAERVLRSALDDIRANAKELGPAEPDFRAHLGSILVGQERYDAALAELDPLFGDAMKEAPPEDPKLVDLRTARAKALAGLHRDSEALPELEAVYALIEPLYGAGTVKCRSLARILAEITARSGDEAAAAVWRSRS